MRRSILIILFLVLLVVGGRFFSQGRSSTSASSRARLAASRREPLLAIPQLPIPMPASRDCRKELDSVLALDATIAASTPTDDLFARLDTCRGDSKLIAAALEELRTTCTESGREETFSKIAAQEHVAIDTLRLSPAETTAFCARALRDLQRSIRASRVDLDHVEDSSDLDGLKNLVLVSPPWSDADSAETWERAIRRILELEPRNDVAAQLFLGKVVDDVVRHRREGDDEDWDRSSREMDWAIEMLPADHPKRAEWELFRLSHGLADDRIESAAREVIDQQGDPSVGWYALSLAAWKSGNWALARSRMNEALRRDPSNIDYQATMSALRAHSDPPFTFGRFPDPEDILRK